jgi:hypothetical protein
MSNRFTVKTEFSLGDAHRDAITSALLFARSIGQGPLRSTKTDAASLCLFCSGSGRELDLRKLLAEFHPITLVDSEGVDLERSVASQGLLEHPQLRFIQGFDLAGIQKEMEPLSADAKVSKRDLSHLIQQVHRCDWRNLPQELYFNASICLLSQMIMKIVETVGEDHAQFVPLVQALRYQHVKLMLDQLVPEGVGLLIFDFVSSDTLPALTELSGEALERCLSAAIGHNNFFHGLNPQVILHLLEQEFKDRISKVHFSKPWVWKTTERAYAVTAATFVKKR